MDRQRAWMQAHETAIGVICENERLSLDAWQKSCCIM